MMKKSRVILMVHVAVVLAAGTVFERYRGAEWVAEHFYGSWWFAVLMGLVAVGSLMAFKVRGERLKVKGTDASTRQVKFSPFTSHLSPFTFIHAAIPIILLGGALTSWTGEHYSITLAPGETKEGITLEHFEVLYYPGTHTPMDFVSHVTADGEPFDISMNHILRHDGRRYYQEDYDDEGRTTLSVSHDPYGIPVTYTGYALLLIGLGWLCLQRKPRQGRQTLAVGVSPRNDEENVSEPRRGDTKPAVDVPPLQGSNPFATQSVGSRPRLKTIVPLGLLLFFNFQLSIFNSAQAAPRTLPRETASKMGEMYVLYKGRVCPLQTLAKDFTTKLTGSATYRGLTSEQVLSGYLFYYGEWVDEPAIKIKGAASLGLDSRASMSQLAFLDTLRVGPATDKNLKAAAEKQSLVRMLLSGKLLKLYPIADSSGTLGWYSQNDDLPLCVDNDEYLFVRRSLSYFQQLVVEGDFEALEEAFDKTRQYQEKRFHPSTFLVGAERLYNALTTGRWLAMVSITFGLLFFAYTLIRKNKQAKWMRVASIVWVAALTAFLLLIFVLRWIIGGHAPMAGGFDSMNLMALVIGIVAMLLCRRHPVALPAGMLTMGFCLLVAMMSGSNPPVTNLMPVLNSPLLTLHVAVIMCSYALFFFVMMGGVTGLIRDGEAYRRLNLLLLYPAVTLLAIGIIIGAIWANISWGNYWSWDPKEVWALITLIIYAIPLHFNENDNENKNHTRFHLYCLLAFLSVVITYFGVNLLLGGLHAYN